MKKRIWELDFLRGFAILMMVFDHFMYDLKDLPSWFSNYTSLTIPDSFVWHVQHLAAEYWVWDVRDFFHFFFISIFLLVSGISFNFSHNNLSRGLKFLLFALLINLVTYGLEYFYGFDAFIFFGVIHMFAFSTLFAWLLRKIWNNNTFILFVGAAFVFVGILFQFWNLPNLAGGYTTDNMVKAILGLGMIGADSFGIFPYTGVLLIGTVIGSLFYKQKESLLPTLDGKWNHGVSWVGRYTIWVFLIHQPIVLGIVIAIGYLLGYQV